MSPEWRCAVRTSWRRPCRSAQCADLNQTPPPLCLTTSYGKLCEAVKHMLGWAHFRRGCAGGRMPMPSRGAKVIHGLNARAPALLLPHAGETARIGHRSLWPRCELNAGPRHPPMTQLHNAGWGHDCGVKAGLQRIRAPCRVGGSWRSLWALRPSRRRSPQSPVACSSSTLAH